MARGSGEYEPRDSRNVTGTASTPDGRWTNTSGQPLDAAGQPHDPEDDLVPDEDDDGAVTFEPDPELLEKIARARAAREAANAGKDRPADMGKIPGTDRPNPG